MSWQLQPHERDAEDDDEIDEREAEQDVPMRVCPDCGGKGHGRTTRDYFGNEPEFVCERCDGTGEIEDDGSDEFDRRCDDYHERQIDREAGL